MIEPGAPGTDLNVLPEEPSSSPPAATTRPPTPGFSGRTRRAGRKRRAREPESPESSSKTAAKRSKATEWRAEQDKEIEENDQQLNNYEAELNDKEMYILIHQAILVGHHHLKTFDYTSKRAYFAEQKRDIEAGKQKLGSIGRAQRKAEYKKAQVLLLESCKSYISTLTEEIQAVSMNINTFPKG